MQWTGKYYFDKILPFGLRSAPFKFTGLSYALEWIAIYDLLINSFVLSPIELIIGIKLP